MRLLAAVPPFEHAVPNGRRSPPKSPSMRAWKAAWCHVGPDYLLTRFAVWKSMWPGFIVSSTTLWPTPAHAGTSTESGAARSRRGRAGRSWITPFDVKTVFFVTIAPPHRRVELQLSGASWCCCQRRFGSRPFRA